MRRTLPLLLVVLSLGLMGADYGARFKAWLYERGDRDAWQQPARVVEALALRPGDRVADVGSGGGYFTRRLAKAVEPGGRVYAVDVDAGINDLLERKLVEEGVRNVSVVLATPADPGLPAGGVDLIFTSNTYHHLPEPSVYFETVKKALGPRGRVAIVEYDPAKAGWFARTFGHATPREEIVAALEAAGYRLSADHGFLERQSFLVFEPAR
jgi:ubiquinone/menaquinone biosynthesis C-methylase UbiE